MFFCGDFLSFIFFRRVESCVLLPILYNVILYEVEFFYFRDASSTCLRCGGGLNDDSGRILQCARCGFVGDRDVILCINILLRYLRCEMPGIALNTPKGGAS
ncbi:MAG: zinc ribbon domain-containing protein [Sulfolobales archaeon]